MYSYSKKTRAHFQLGTRLQGRDQLLKDVTHDLATDDYTCSKVFEHAPQLKAFADQC